MKKILASDPTDVLARHDFDLSYRNKGWLKESFEEMRKANEYAVIYGNAEEMKIIKASLNLLEVRSKKVAFASFSSLATKRSRVKRKGT